MHRFYLGFSLCSDVTEPQMKAVEITIGTVGRRLSLQRYRAANESG